MASLWYGQNHGLLPEASSEEAVLYDALFNALLTIAFGLFLLVESILIYSMIVFRKREGDETDGPAIHDNFLLETIWTAIPAVTVMWIGIYSFDVYSAMRGNPTLEILADNNGAPIVNLAMAEARADEIPGQGEPVTAPSIASNQNQQNQLVAQVGDPPRPDEVAIDVTAMQFAWIFTYPGDVITAELHVPTGREVHLNMTASDVIHAFWVPEIRLKQDVIPGSTTNLLFRPNKVGEYTIVCAELCGAYHGGMKAQMIVQTEEDYNAWLIEQQEMAANSNPVIANRPNRESDSSYLQAHATDIAQRIGFDRPMLDQMQMTAHHHHD